MTEERPSLARIYWILMKPRVVFLLQATAICGVLIYDLGEGYKNEGWKPIDSVITSLIVLIGGSLASGGSIFSEIRPLKLMKVLETVSKPL